MLLLLQTENPEKEEQSQQMTGLVPPSKDEQRRSFPSASKQLRSTVRCKIALNIHPAYDDYYDYTSALLLHSSKRQS